MLILIPSLETPQLLAQRLEVSPLGQVVAVRMGRCLSPQESIQIFPEIVDQFSDIKVALKTFNVASIRKVPNFIMVAHRSVPFNGGHRLPADVK
eukprot:3690118-Pyramimonas_sp.AAC.1